MERGRVAETELMPSLVVGNAELGCSKWKSGKGFLKPNSGLGPNNFLSHSFEELQIRHGQGVLA